MAELTMVEASNRALVEAMEADESVLVLGQDVGVDGGVFRVTDGLLDRFGASRSVDAPLAESAIVGASIGMAVAGLRPVCEMQFSGLSDFGFHQLESAHTPGLKVAMPSGPRLARGLLRTAIEDW